MPPPREAPRLLLARAGTRLVARHRAARRLVPVELSGQLHRAGPVVSPRTRAPGPRAAPDALGLVFHQRPLVRGRHCLRGAWRRSSSRPAGPPGPTGVALPPPANEHDAGRRGRAGPPRRRTAQAKASAGPRPARSASAGCTDQAHEASPKTAGQVRRPCTWCGGWRAGWLAVCTCRVSSRCAYSGGAVLLENDARSNLVRSTLAVDQLCRAGIIAWFTSRVTGTNRAGWPGASRPSAVAGVAES